MAKKISQLTQATQVKSDDVTVIVQDGETKKLPLNMMVTKQDIENKKVAGLAKLDEIEATYENDTYTPTITVKNKSSVKVGEGDGVDYSANVMDGHAKSAILKGQTLVNLLQNAYVSNGVMRDANVSYSKTDTTYTLIYNVTALPTTTIRSTFMVNLSNGTTMYQTIAPNVRHKMGINKWVFKTPTDGTFDAIGYWSNNEDIKLCANNIVLLEGDYTNVDIPYFEGMQSVKMPVLTTTGKNLFDKEAFYNDWKSKKDTYVYKEIVDNEEVLKVNNFHHLFGDDKGFRINVKKGVPLTLRMECKMAGTNTTNSVFAIRYDDKKYLDFPVCKSDEWVANTTTFIPTRDYITFCSGYNYDDYHYVKNIQLEEGRVATTYKPHKSNILTVNEEVELGGIGEVKDELNLMTGEITSYSYNYTITGNESWSDWTNDLGEYVTFYFYYKNSNMPNIPNEKVGKGICNKFKVVTNVYNTQQRAIGIGREYLSLGIKFSELNITSDSTRSERVNALKTWLKNNNVEIRLPYAQEVVKTVDLMPSGTHPSTTPYCWKNGHIQLSSSGLLPNLEYSVVTSRAGQINQNAAMIVKNDKRIFDLEILLAGGLVNTTYQALTLQNQVETGLSKVSLNSEKEPDYLLYHMIMKLIEEKAYKLDDLTEKVSVFYLYEKLSDEQFETIYSALYPFVEDEIVEEPVVEELPEVVEDEVIM